MKILLVDTQEESVQKKTALMEYMQDCQLDIVNAWKDAVLAARAKKYDCVLVDLDLADKIGFEAACEIRHDEESLDRSVPIAGLVSERTEEIQKEALSVCIHCLINKPLDEKEVGQIVSLVKAVGA